MNRIPSLAVAGLAALALIPSPSRADHCNWYICTPYGPVGQYNAFSPICKEPRPQNHGPCQFNAFTPIQANCIPRCRFGFSHFIHGSRTEITTDNSCWDQSAGCEWGCQGHLPESAPSVTTAPTTPVPSTTATPLPKGPDSSK